MNRLVVLFCICSVSAIAVYSRPAVAGFHVIHDCEYGVDLAPAGPNPNLYCEMSWDETGYPLVNYADFNSKVVWTNNPAVKDEDYFPRFDMRTTQQPVISYIRCTTATGIFNITTISTTWRKTPKGGYEPVDLVGGTANGYIIANGC
jgi:hypothetical protein